MTTVHTSSIQSLPLLARGKVRDNYAVGKGFCGRGEDGFG